MSYVVENGVGQWRLFNRARPVEEVLKSPRTSETTRAAIRVVGKAKHFAVKELGLSATKNYETFVQLDSPCVVWAVSAAHPLALEEKKWKFPFVGEVPYLGFFQKGSADEEAARIRAEEQPTPDTWVRCVPAFSSLGWFSDPLYSSMLKGTERDIAELVIHESLHATVWVGNSVDFNEKLANYVGLEGSLRYISREKGDDAWKEAKLIVAGEKLFGDFMNEMVSFYKSSVRDEAAKKEFYGSLPRRYETFLDKKRKEGFLFKSMEAKMANWNNAALLTYANYYSDFSVFEAMLAKCGGDLPRFVRWISEEQKKTERFRSAPEEHLAELVKSSSCTN